MKFIQVIFLYSVMHLHIFGIFDYRKYLPKFLTESESIYPQYSVLYTYELHKKKLQYFSALLSNNFESAERATIAYLLQNEKPDICILHGFQTDEGISPQRIISIAQSLHKEKIGGENTYAAYMCYKYDIPFIGGDINQKKLLQELIDCGYAQEDIVFYMLLQQIPFWDRDNLLDKQEQERQFERFMNNEIREWLGVTEFYTYKTFCNWFQHYYAKPFNVKEFLWDNVDANTWSCSRSASASIHQKICADYMNIKDNYFIDVIRKTLAMHHNVLVISPASHTGSRYIWQKEALASFLGKPASEKIIR